MRRVGSQAASLTRPASFQLVDLVGQQRQPGRLSSESAKMADFRFLRHSSFELRHCFHAPRILDTSGRLSIRSRISSSEAFLISSTVIAFATSNRPDFVRRSDFKYAPQPRASPMSCTYVRT